MIKGCGSIPHLPMGFYMKSKISKCLIIGAFIFALIFCTVDFSLWVLDRIGITDVGYKTVEEAVLKEKSIDVDEIMGILTDEEFSLVICRDAGTYFTEIVRHKDDAYYFCDENYKQLYFELHNNHYINVLRIDNLDLVIIKDSMNATKKVVIEDNISSEFQFMENNDLLGYSNRYWFLVLDELPDNYTIIIDGKKIPIVTK